MTVVKQSHLFTKTRREAPSDEVSKNAQLLIRAGFIHKEMAGVYDLLPLGLRTLEKINTIIREEMNAIGGQEVFLSALQDKALWEKTDRWSDDVVDNWFKTRLKNDAELGLGFTHEEPLTVLMTGHISSYRDLPRAVYQIQTKFRNELRAKSGIMRGREFLMKDLYSFCKNDEEQATFYERAKEAYTKVFDRVGLGDRTYLTFASGGVFSKYSHEFQTVSDAGEDLIYVDEKKGIAINKEVLTDEVINDLGVTRESLIEKSAIEVGNIFNLGTRFSEALGLTYKTEDGKTAPVVMGSYGIGPTRLMGTIAEVLADEKGLIWPKSVAPFGVHLIEIGGEKADVREAAEKLSLTLAQKGIDVLHDDRDIRAGEKFADADLIGIPIRIVVSEKTIATNSCEIKMRTETESQIVSYEEAIDRVHSS
ncbi:MAG: aminoacyl--tRNA ligase-related protein [Patescibacteria group bacterium]